MKYNDFNYIPRPHPFDRFRNFDEDDLRGFEDFTDEKIEELLNKKEKYFNHMEKLIKEKREQEKAREKEKESGRLQPLSIRIKEHTKKFLKEESKLTAREILELYEEYITGNEIFKETLQQEKQQLLKELDDIEDKIQEVELFQEKLKRIEQEKNDDEKEEDDDE